METKIKRTINKKISLLAAVGILIIVIVSQVLGGLELKTVMTDNCREILKAEAKNNANIIDGWLDDQTDIIVCMMDSLVYMDELDADKIMDYLEVQLSRNEDALMYYVCFEYNKSVLPADHSYIELDPTERAWWKKAVKEGGVIYTEPYVDFATGQMIVSVAAPFKIQNEQAVILADVTIDRLVGIVNNISNREDTDAFLLAEDGSVITHPNDEYLPKEEGNTVLTDVVDIVTDTEEVTEFTDYDGSRRYLSIYNVEANGWKIGVTQNQKTLTSRIQSYVMSNLVKISILAAIAIILLFIVLTRLLNPVNGIVNAILHISEGDFSVKVRESRKKDEIATLQNMVYELTLTLSAIIGDANRVMGDIAAYNLASDDMKEYPGDFNQLSVSVNSVKNILCGLLAKVQKAASGVQANSMQLTSAADSLSHGSVAQAGSIQELTDDIESMAERIRRSSESCRQADYLLADLDSKIKAGNQEMASLLSAVSEIEKMSNDIQKIIGAIDGIASQTNILALNASVEAARAGERGKGFAVVASEIRALAENCAEESRKTSELLDGCLRVISDMKVCADITSEKLDEVEDNSAGVYGSFRAVYNEMERQAKDSDSIRSGVVHISDVVQSNTAAAEQTAAASATLSEEAADLTGMVERFVV